VTVARVEQVQMQVRLYLGGDREETIRGSHLLIAAGRRPHVDGLASGRPHRGRPAWDHRQSEIADYQPPRLRHRGRRRRRFTHAANHHAGLVIRSALFRLPVRRGRQCHPAVIFTIPSWSQSVSHRGAGARSAGAVSGSCGGPTTTTTAQTERDPRGHIKIVTDRRGRILGATIVGAAAGELITTWTLALSQKLNIRAFAGIVVPYPTLAEIGKRAAMTYFNRSLTSSWVRRIIAWLRRLG
jgi:pyruvate/2-oxoglutarate dehydrogenase complex dihydrolipoamide dehydrogenase (E3) component